MARKITAKTYYIVAGVLFIAFLLQLYGIFGYLIHMQEDWSIIILLLITAFLFALAAVHYIAKGRNLTSID